MPIVRLQHLFYFLMLLAGLSAFVIPAKYTDKAVPQLQALLWPVARPARALGSMIEGRTVEAPLSAQGAQSLRELNDQLVQENIKLRHDRDAFAVKLAERDKLGEIGDLCLPVAVVGGDAGTRESLAVAGSSLEGLKDGMFVLYPGGVVGTLQRSGVAGGQVQLITNPGFRVTAFFSGLRRVDPKVQSPSDAKPGDGKTPVEQYQRLNRDPVLVQGAGNGTMLCRLTRTEKERMGLQPGDWVVAEDPEWPAQLKGRGLGKIIDIKPQSGAPLFVQVRIAPANDLLKLREVMVFRNEK